MFRQIIFIVGLFLSGCNSNISKPQTKNKIVYMKTSYYNGFGHRTASGKMFNNLSVAHKSLPFNTKILLTNEKTGYKIESRITDRGPFIRGRELDVSGYIAERLGFKYKGTEILKVEVLND